MERKYSCIQLGISNLELFMLGRENKSWKGSLEIAMILLEEFAFQGCL